MAVKSLKYMAIGASALGLALGAASEKTYADYPEKPVEMTVLFGGTANSIGQVLADLMSKNMPQPVVPVSRTGGGGAVGYTHVQSTPADGYNIVWNSNSVSTSYYAGNMQFNYEAFTPIARVSTEVPTLAVRSDSGWNSLPEMVEAVKNASEPLKVGISGNGSFTHLTSVALFQAAGIGDKVVYVPYGEGRAPAELLGGRIDAALQWAGQFAPHVEAGTLRVLAVTGDERIALLPDVPTAMEQGVDVNITMWRGLAAPKDTPPEVVAALEEAAKKATEAPEFVEASEKLGFSPAFMPASEFAELIATDDAKIGTLMEELGIKKQ